MPPGRWFRRRRPAVVVLCSIGSLLAASSLAGAQTAAGEPKSSSGSKEEAAELQQAAGAEWKLAAQASLMLTTGNSRDTTFGGGLNGSRKANRNKFSLEAAAAYARSSILLAADENGSGAIDPDEISRQSQTTTQSWLGKGRYDRYLTVADALFAALGISADKPAGKELVGSAQVGYSRQLYQDAVHLIVAEAGYDFTYEDQVGGDPISIHSIRGFVGYTAKLSPDTGLDASVEVLSNLNQLDAPAGEVDSFDDTRVNGKISLSTALLQKITFRVAFEARYDHAPALRPPFSLPYAAGFLPVADDLDTRTEAALIVNFL